MPVRWPVGGIRTYLRDLLSSDAFRDVAVEVILPRHAESQLLADEAAASSTKWIFAPFDTTASIVSAVLARLAQRNYDLVHSHGFTAATIAALPALAVRRPHLLTAHEVIVESQFAGRCPAVKRNILRGTLKSVSAIHCVSHGAKENMISFVPELASRTRVEVIEHGVNVARFATGGSTDLRADLGIGPTTTIFGFLGRFMEPKGFDVLIEAVNLLSRRYAADRFRVLAMGYGGYLREQQSRITSRGLEQRFSFLPFVNDVAPFLRGLDCVVMPSRWEASGLVAMEALVCGVPLIASSCIGLRETLEGTPAITVPPDKPVDLAAAMEARLLDDGKHEAATYAPQGAVRFDNRRSFERLKKLLSEVAAI